jgi:hypothetical protein
VTFKEALVNPLYRKATWVVLGLNFFNQACGVQMIVTYSNLILSLIYNPGP